jgi:hypothetical protein
MEDTSPTMITEILEVGDNMAEELGGYHPLPGETGSDPLGNMSIHLGDGFKI